MATGTLLVDGKLQQDETWSMYTQTLPQIRRDMPLITYLFLDSAKLFSSSCRENLRAPPHHHTTKPHRKRNVGVQRTGERD